MTSLNIEMKGLWMVALVILCAGCSPKDQTDIEGQAKQVVRDTGQAASSLTLEGKVSSVLRLMKKIDHSDVHVEAKDGVVTLTGSAENADQRRFIVVTTNGIKGVDKVVDHMVVAKSGS